MAEHAHTPPPTRMPTRRRLLAGSGLAAGLAALALPAAALPPIAPQPDAELIRVCHQFAEYELEDWYRYAANPSDPSDSFASVDWERLRWITETPATTLEGMRAKALAYAAWNRDGYDNEPSERHEGTTLLAALLRDMVAPARAAILARLAVRYGPLPSDYSADGIWLGSDARPAAVAMPTSAADPDAELIAVCAAFNVAENKVRAIYDGPTSIADDDRADAAAEIERDEMQVLLRRMASLKAATPAGVHARAHSLALHNGDGAYSYDYEETIAGQLLGYLVRDAAVVGGAD